jgi:hypothetical protein
MIMKIADYADDAYLMRRVSVQQETNCWEWKLSKVKGGYGKASLRGATLVAHRAVWEARIGPVPEGMILCHSCDNPSCVNPSHLFLGTHQDNSADMVYKNRQAKGEKIFLTKLDVETVCKVRSEKGTYADIARRLGLKSGNVRLIKRGETWKHVA